MCSEVRFRRAIRGWLVGCVTVTAVIYVLLVGFLASGPRSLSIHSIGAGIYFALVPPAIILVITCAVTGLSEKLGMRSFLFFGCAGGAIGTLSQAVIFRTLSNFTWFFVVVGFLAGLGYWIVAGRHAGRDGDLPGETA
jgi:membrane protease YdiL (CAAX protease family)